MYTTYIYILITMVFSALFSGTEIAFVSSSKMRFELDKNNQSLTGKILSIFYRHPNQFISSLLVGNNIALVIYGIMMAKVIETYLLHDIVESPGLLVLIETILSTLIILVTGEFLPKTIFRINPNKTLKIIAIPMFFIYILLYPISKFTSSLSEGLLWIIGKRVDRKVANSAFSKVDLDYFIQSSLERSTNENEVDTEVKIFQNALDFSNIKVRDCFVPRTEIQAVEANITLENLKQAFIESGHSKLIVYKDNIDNIVGYIHSSEMFRHPQEWALHIQQVPIIPETMSAQRLMEMFMQQKKTLAVVVDEFGGTSGVVSLEDLVEEIFGDIEDEHDTTSYVAKKLDNSEYILSARLEIEKANEMFDLELPESEDYLTIGGLILHEYQSFPKLNETVIIGKYQFKIVKISTTKIELVQLKVTE